MKTRKLTIEAQQICLVAAKEVFNFLEIAFTNMEKDGWFSEEPILEMRPYNSGYQIRIDASLNYENKAAENLPRFFQSIDIQPNAFFEQYMAEGKNARIEYSHFFKRATGNLHNGTPIMSTNGIDDVISMSHFQILANKWVKLIKREINNI